MTKQRTVKAKNIKIDETGRVVVDDPELAKDLANHIEDLSDDEGVNLYKCDDYGNTGC